MRKFFGHLSEFATLGLVAFILIVGPLNWGSRSVTAQGWIHIAASFLLFFWMIRLMCLADPVFVKTSVTLPLFLFFGYLFLRYLLCDAKWIARQEVLMMMSYGVIFLAVVHNLQRRWQLQALLWLILLIATAEAVDGIVRQYRGVLDEACRFFFWDCTPRTGYQNQFRAGGTFWTPDHYAAYLILAVGLIMPHLVLLKRSWTQRVLLGYMGACVMLGIALSKSRGGWISLLCTVPFLALLVIRGKLLDFRSGLVAMIVLAGVAYFLYTKHGLVAERMQDLAEQGEPTREKTYLTALQMAKDHPLFGVGPRMYDTYFWRYTFNETGPEFVHCEFLQVLADLGLVGAGLAGWLVVAFYRSAFQMTAPQDSEYNPHVSSEVARRLAFVVGGTAAVFAMTVHSAFDFVLHVAAVGVTLAVIVGLIYASAAFRRKRSETDLELFGFDRVHKNLPLSATQQRVVQVALGAAFLYFLVLSGNNYLSMVWRDEGYKRAHQEEPDRDGAIRCFETSLLFDPRNSAAALWLGTVYWEKTQGNYDLNNTTMEYYRKAMHWHDEAVRTNPHFTDAYLNRANLYILTNQPELARKDCEKLAALAPYNPLYRLLYGKVCLILADYKSAQDQLRLAAKLGQEAGLRQGYEAQQLLDLIEKMPLPPQPE